MSLLRVRVAMVWSLSALGQAQGPAKTLDFPRFKLVPGEVRGDDPVSGAKLCTLRGPGTCFRREPYRPTDEKFIYEFARDPRSERIPLRGGGSLVFFSATYSAVEPLMFDRLALLRYEGAGHLVNLLPYISVSFQGERAMWTLDDISPMPVLVMADLYWDFDAKETRWDDHRYFVEAYRYDAASGRYVFLFKYLAKKKYESGDSKPVRVLGPERDEIMRRLRAGKS